jgi:hypothetical protein
LKKRKRKQKEQEDEQEEGRKRRRRRSRGNNVNMICLSGEVQGESEQGKYQKIKADYSSKAGVLMNFMSSNICPFRTDDLRLRLTSSFAYRTIDCIESQQSKYSALKKE